MLATRSSRVNLCYSRRPSRADPGDVNPCAFGLSPEFSTPVEKTVENHEISSISAYFLLFGGEAWLKSA
jgi:hypothetical protein